MGLKNFWSNLALEWKFCANLGSRTANLVKFVILLKRGLKELKHAEIGIGNC